MPGNEDYDILKSVNVYSQRLEKNQDDLILDNLMLQKEIDSAKICLNFGRINNKKT
ncbi:MAG: hypothetical protein IC227_06465 [Enterococcus lacertideformus]|uniref:Uncharacterized protein n=1 Tax=Enterococcus lacertideformus TaxID=2771493 RepID=A0A931FCS3_9ENTE|nr:hypothetical protein [Enterococcus lacertideformus]